MWKDRRKKPKSKNSKDRRKNMKLRKMTAIFAAAAMVFSLAACGAKDTASDDGTKKDTEAETMIVDKENKEITMLCEVNGTYFTEPTRHGIVYAEGSNGEKAVLRGLADEKEFYQALLDIGATAGDNLTYEDMKAGPDNGKAVEGDKLNVFVKWEGQDEIPFADIIKCSEGEYEMDIRFGGNIESAKKHNTGCVLCLDSCATGITSDATWPTGTTQNEVAKFYGDDSVLPEDGTQVTVIFRLAE